MNARTASLIARSGRSLAALLYTFAVGTVAFADDTEILTGQSLPFAAPNILFVIDTSGSMDAQVLINDNYDPAVTYTGPFNDASRIYYTRVDNSGNFDYPEPGYEQSGNWVATNAFVCAAAQSSFDSIGRYADYYAQFVTDEDDDTGNWGFLTENANTLTTECLADEGIDGGTNNPTTDFYPVNVDDLDLNPDGYSADENDPARFDWFNDTNQYVFFSNNQLNWVAQSIADGDPVVKSRLRIVQDVTQNLVDSISISNQDPDQRYNVGLMRFSRDAEGGMVLQAVSDISDNRQSMIDAVGALAPDGNTPLSESVFEAYQYFRGAPVQFGLDSMPVPSTPDSRTGDVYNSPTISSCQKNYVVLLTDGQPTSDDEADAAIEALTGACDGNCLDELTNYMATADFSTLNDTQTVKTFTIGFFTDSDLLEAAATGQVFYDMNGDPLDPPREGYFTADDTDQLQVAFDSILTSINSDVDTFTSPAVSVDSLNRLTNRNVLYFTMFVPASQGEPHWDGNLKAYFVGRENQDGTGDITILDADMREATEAGGTFKSDARSIWSSSADGGIVTEGGFVSTLGTDRLIVSNIVGGSLFTDDNLVSEDNDLITNADLNIDETEDREGLLRFARGLNDDGTARQIIGDPLHTQPLVVTYASADGEDLALFFATNDGYFHHVDPTPANDTNVELEEFAFIPRELLDNLSTIKENPPSLPSDFDKVYGIDGSITAYIQGDENGIVDPGERLYVIFGMRRGGKSYYALDFGIGGKSAPRLAWKISRGDANFAKLGQTWSAATPAKVSFGGSDRDVIIFGGGYSTAQDSAFGPNTNEGNAIYMVDAQTGAHIWSASNAGATLNIPEMEYPIPSDIAVLDINRDGYTDRLYFGDMGGQVFRIDINNDDTGGASSAITGTRMAALAEGGAGGERRFYNRPSVARIVPTQDSSFLSISLGSGFRAHPLDTSTNDRFYLLKDPHVFTPPVDSNGDIDYPDALTNTDLLEIDVATPPSPADLAGSGGWFIELDAGNGEKSLSAALTVQNQVFFATYSPQSTQLSCVPTAARGQGRLYAIDIFTGLPALFIDSETEEPEYFMELARTGIPPSPTLVFTEPPCPDCGDNDDGDDDDDDGDDVPYGGLGCEGAVSEATMFLATETVNPFICTAPVRTYWYESDVDEDDD